MKDQSSEAPRHDTKQFQLYKVDGEAGWINPLHEDLKLLMAMTSMNLKM